MDRWMNVWVCVLLDGWMDGWMDGCVGEWLDVCVWVCVGVGVCVWGGGRRPNRSMNMPNGNVMAEVTDIATTKMRFMRVRCAGQPPGFVVTRCWASRTKAVVWV